jgi:hypothetical protein
LNKAIPVEYGISDIVGCLTDPIIVFPGGWGDILLEWLKTAITLERMTDNLKTIKGGEPTGTDAEACAYLNTASLTAPMDNDWSQIYLYVATKTYSHWGKGEMPADIAVDSINEYKMKELSRLKSWLYQQRVNARVVKERAECRQEKEKADAQKKVEQPALFEF